MRAHGIDMWIVIDRENNEEPLHDEVGGGYPGVRGAYVFYDRGEDGIEKLFFGSHEQPSTAIVPHLYDSVSYYGYSPEGLTPLIREAVAERQPEKIGVNRSSTLPEADGLTAGLQDFLKDALAPEYGARMVSAELLVRDFRLHKVPEETEVYTQLLQWTDRWMKEGFAMVTPGQTTAADLYWVDGAASPGRGARDRCERLERCSYRSRGRTAPARQQPCHRARRHRQHR